MNFRVKELIKEKGMTMQEFADVLGIARVNLTSQLKGNPTINTLEKIAAALDVPVMELFEPKATDEIICPVCKTAFKIKNPVSSE